MEDLEAHPADSLTVHLQSSLDHVAHPGDTQECDPTFLALEDQGDLMDQEDLGARTLILAHEAPLHT